MTKRSWRKTTALAICILMLLQLSCLSAFADEVGALGAINSASNATSMEAAIVSYATDLATAGIDLTVYNKLSLASKQIVAGSLIGPMYNGLATGTIPFITAFNTAISNATIVKYNPVVEDMQYIPWTPTYVNASNNWSSKLLYKLDVSRPMYKSDFLLQSNVNIRKIARGAENNTYLSSTKVRAIDFYPDWNQYRDNGTTLGTYGLTTDTTTDRNVTTTSEYIYPFTVTGFGDNSSKAFDLTEYVKIKASKATDVQPFASLIFDGLPTGFYATSEDTNAAGHRLGIYSTFDKQAILDAFNNSNSSNIGGLIANNGEVFGLNANEYINLCNASKYEVNKAMLLGKPFTNLSGVVSVYNTAVNSVLVKEKYNITEDYQLFFKDNPPTLYNSISSTAWLNTTTSEAWTFYFTLNPAKTQFVASKRMYVFARGASNTSCAITTRDLLSMPSTYTGVAQKVLSISEYPGTSGVFYPLDVSRAVIDSQGMIKIALNGVMSNLYNVNLGSLPYISGKADGVTKMPYVDIGYDKLAVANGIAGAGSIESAEALLKTYHSIIGIADSAQNDYTAYAGKLLGETIGSFDQLTTILTTLGSGIKTGGLTAGFVSDSSIGGVVTIKNFTTSPKNFKLIVAAYTTDNLMITAKIVDTGVDNDIISAGAIKPYGYTLDGVTAAAKVRTFFWNDFSTLTPYETSKSVVIE